MIFAARRTVGEIKVFFLRAFQVVVVVGNSAVGLTWDAGGAKCLDSQQVGSVFA